MRNKKEMKWARHFFEEAIHWSKLSPDPHTKCGAIMVAPDNTIVSAGYNGFIRSIDETDMPLTRPEKYPYMIHAEANCIYNAARQGKTVGGTTMYITGPPCTTCLQAMWQCGISRILYTDYQVPKMCTGMEYFGLTSKLTQKMSGSIEIDYFAMKELGI